MLQQSPSSKSSSKKPEAPASQTEKQSGWGPTRAMGLLLCGALLVAGKDELLSRRAAPPRPDSVAALQQKKLFTEVATCSKDIEQNPRAASAYYNRACALQELGKHDMAVLDYCKVLELDPRDPSALYNRGCAFQELKKFDSAVSDYTRAIELDPTHAMAYYNRGCAFRELGKPDAAEKDYRATIERDPNYAPAYNNLGSVFLSYSEPYFAERAVQEFSKAIERQPSYAVAYFNRAKAQAKREKFAEVVADCSKAIDLDPKNPYAYFERAKAFSKLGRHEERRIDCTRCIELNPTFIHAYSERVSALLDMEIPEFNLLLADISKCIELAPGDEKFSGKMGKLIGTRGLCLASLERHAEAVVDLKKALELEPANTTFGKQLNTSLQHLSKGGR